MKKHFFSLAILVSLVLFSCTDPVSKEKRPLVSLANKKIRQIDGNHRVQIIEDDFHEGDSSYKIRAYYMDDDLLKIVTILRTSNYERDDYFYFENNRPIFSGHLFNEKNDHLASEYKYYYDKGTVVESLYWEDHYTPGLRFDHERFQEYEPNIDSLMSSEKERLQFYLSKLDMEGFEVLHLNENLDAN